jgi:hypothetical protein
VSYGIKSGKEVRTFSGHSGNVYSVCFSPDGKKFLSSSIDKTMKLWDVATGKILCSIYFVNDNGYAVVTPEGRYDGTEDAIKQLYYVKGMEIITLESLFEQCYTPNLLARLMDGEQFPPINISIDGLTPKPSVRITAPNSDIRGIKIVNNIFQSEQQTIEVAVEATDQGGGIDELTLYQNGKLVETSGKGLKTSVQKNELLVKIFNISLIPGENVIKATAFNIQRTETFSDEIIIKYSGSQTTKPNLFLLVIGINEYKNSKYNLNYAVADAQEFLKQMEWGGNEIFGNITSSYVSNTEATKQRISEEFDKIKMQIKPEDVFVFYYAGHGAMSSEEKPMYYLIPTDVLQMFFAPHLQEKAISANELKEFSAGIRAQKQMFVLDACQSGGMSEVLAARGAAEEKAIAQLAKSTGTFWLTASNSEQFAGEFAQLGHGLFTYCILQAFSGKADGQNDKKITVQELSAHLNDQVPIISKQYKGMEQFPVFYGSGNDFPIIIVK